MMVIHGVAASLLILPWQMNVARAQPVSRQEPGQRATCPPTELAAIKKQWAEWAAAYAAHDLAKTMKIFDRDVIFSFQGAADQTYSDLERAYRDGFAKPDNKLEWVPQFEEFACSGDLGFVRSTWVLRQTDASGKVKDLEKNRGVDLLRRHSLNHWKIFRSLNYPFRPPSK